jgi:hypothetical protein
MDSQKLIAETIQSPGHTVHFAEALANGDISPDCYEKLRAEVVNGVNGVNGMEARIYVRLAALITVVTVVIYFAT